MNIYDRCAWKRIEATVSAVAGWTAYSTFIDSRASRSTAAYPAPAATTGEFIDCAIDPAKNRIYVMYQYST